MARKDLMYRVRFEDPSLSQLSSDELADMMYQRHVNAATSGGVKPTDFESFKRDIGYFADAYDRGGTSPADYGRELMAGGAALVEGVSALGGRALGVRPEDNPLVQAADRAQEYWREGQTPGYEYAMSQPGISTEKVGAALAGSLLPMAAGAGIAGLGLRGLAATRGGAALATRAGAGDAAAATTLNRISTGLLGGSEGLVAGSISAQENYQRVMELPLATLMDSQEFLDEFVATDERLPYEDRVLLARQNLADSIAAQTGLQVGGATALLGPVGGGQALGRFIRGEGAGVRGTLAATGREAVEEGLQSGAETYLGQRQLQRADVEVDPLEGVGEAALLGAVTGGTFGAIGSQLGRLRRRDIAPQMQGLSDQNDLLLSREEAAPTAPVVVPDAQPTLRPGLGRALYPQTDLLSRDPRTIAVTPFRAEETPVLGERPAAAMPTEFELAEIENRRAELQQILDSSTVPAQRRAIQAELDALPLPPIEFTPVARPEVATSRRLTVPEMPEVRMPAVQRTLFGAPEPLEAEGPQIPEAARAPEFSLEMQEPLEAAQQDLELQAPEEAAPATVDERQATMDLRTPEERAAFAQQKLAEPVPTLRDLLPTLPRGITPSRMMAIAAVRANADLPVTEALPAIAKALKPVKLAGETKAKVTEFLRHFKQQADSIQAERTALQADLLPAPQPEMPTDGTAASTQEGRKFRDFFAGITRGEAGAPTQQGSTKVLNAERNQEVVDEYMKYSGAFDRHIEASIPGFRDVQFKVAEAIAKSYDKADVLDIGASEGALVKTSSSLNPGISSVALDPNPGMQATFDTKPQVEGAEFVLAALGSKEQEGQVAWQDEGQDVPYFKPDRKFDVVHEAMVFQFISRDRDTQVARVKELMKPKGVAIFEEKFTAGKGLTEEQYKAGEAQKDEFKKQFFSEAEMKAKADSVLVGMNKNMPSPGEFEDVLKANFKNVVQFWDSGNFRGYAASDDAQALQTLVGNIGDTSSPFSSVATPRNIAGEAEALFSLNTQSPLVEVFQKLGSVDEAYRSGVSTSDDLQTVLNDVLGKERGWEALMGDGQTAIIALDGVAVATIHYDDAAIDEHHKPEEGIYIPENSVVVQIAPSFPDFGQGAGLGRVYQAIFNWALNTGRTVRPDSGGLTPVNALRRSEQMLTSMLRTGTSEHVAPHWTQLAPLALNMGLKASPSTYTSTLWGDERQAGTPEERAAIYQANLHNLLLASSLMAHGAPRSKADVKEGNVQGVAKLGNWVADTEGKLYEVQSKAGALRFNEVADLAAAIPEAAKKEYGVGPTTARRAVVTRQALLGITPAGLGNFGRVAAESAYRFERGTTVPTPPSRTMVGYPGLARIEPGQGFWHRLFYSLAPAVQPVTGAPDVQRVVDEVTAKWGDTAKVRVVESVQDLPASVQAQFQRTGAPDSAVEGVYMPSTGDIYLVAPNLSSEQRIREVLAHEAVGHYAMERLVSMDNLVTQIQILEKGKAPAIVEAASWVDANQPGLDPVIRAKEIIAVLAERAEHKRVPLLKRMVAALRNWLRTKGFARSWVDTLSENDVLHLLRHAEAYLRDPSAYPHPLLANVPSWRDRAMLRPEDNEAAETESSDALASVNLKRKALAQKKNVSVAALKGQVFGYSLDQLANSFSKYIPALPEYYDLHGRRDAAMTESLKPAEDLFSEWAAWAATNGEQQTKLGQFAIESTRRNIHADRAYKNEAEFLADQPWLKNQKNAFDDYLVLNKEWKALSPEARKWYGTIRDFYSKQWSDIKKEMRAFVERQTEPGSPEREDMLKELDREFGRVQGPYFPLMRIGEYLVIAQAPGKERIVSAVETPAQAALLAEELIARGYPRDNVVRKVAAGYNQVTDGVPSKFVDSIDKMIDARINSSVIDKEVGHEMKAFINQLYLHSLPDITGRKMLMNRQGVAGAEQDLLRVFAKSSYQTAFLKSRLRWQSQIREALNSIEQEVREVTSLESERYDPTADGEALTLLLRELQDRYALQAQPDPAPALSKIQSLMYMWYLGLAPAYYMTNLLQVPIVTTPELAKKYPLPKVLAAMTKAYAKALPIVTSTWWKDSKMFARSGVVKGAYDFDAATNLTNDEREMLKRGILDGRLDVTLAYDLGNVAMGNSPTWHKISKGVTYMGHTTEVLNRMVTALAAYDLSKDLAYTWRAVDSTQFNYAAYNKPRFMNPKWFKGAGIVFQFQQYRQRMVYNVAKAFRDSVTNDETLTPQEKREARRYLAGVIGTHFLFAGLVGIPFAMTFVQLINAVLNAVRDDEEPEVDILLEGRKALADLAENYMSEDAARATSEAILKGAPRAVNVDLSGRVGAGEIMPWSRETARGKTGKDWYFEQFATTIGGPFGGFLANVLEAKEKADQGKVVEAIATTSPRAMRDLLGAYLLGTQGVRTGGGYDTGFKPTDTEVFLKTIGLQPGRLAEFQEARGEIIGRQQKLRSQRSLLKKQWVMAKQDNDRDEMKDIQERIRVFNRANPKSRIEQGDLYKELKRIDKLMHDPNFYMGVKLNKGERAMAGEVSDEFNTEE